MNLKIKEIALGGLGVAIVFCATFFIKIPNQIDGYMNLGDGFILLFATILNPFLAFMIGGFGSALADLAGGYGHYFFFTLIIKGLEAAIVAYWSNKFSGYKTRVIGYILGLAVMIVGYFLTKWYLKSSIIVAISGIPGNIMQATLGIIIVLLLAPLATRQAQKYFK
jgi:Predicted membrane protein